MKKLFSLALAFTLLVACSGPEAKKEEVKKEAMRIVSLNGTITEIVYALGEEKQLVAVDITSTYPEAATKLTNLGHLSAISAEGILGSSPTHVIGFADEIKPELLDQLKNAKVEVVLFERDYSIKGAKKAIRDIAKWLEKEEEGKKLEDQIDADVKGLSPLTSKPAVLFVYARGAGTMMVAGDDTQMEKMIELAGGKNAVGGFNEFKPLTPESVIAANPDLLLLFESGTQSLNGEAGLLEIPGIKLTTAGKNKQFLSMDGLLLSGFGPRVGKALSILNGELKKITK